jgi:hypothetical protein
LERISKLKAELADPRELANLLHSAEVRLEDARQFLLSLDSRFDLAYNAAHAASLTALRAHGFRSENRFLVPKCLEHTLGFTPQQWRLLDQAHKKRNLAEYEGELDITVNFVNELLDIAENFVAASKQIAFGSEE